MFVLDNLIVGWAYAKCLALGTTFYLGAFEGFVIYLGIIVAVVFKAMEKKKVKK